MFFLLFLFPSLPLLLANDFATIEYSVNQSGFKHPQDLFLRLAIFITKDDLNINGDDFIMKNTLRELAALQYVLLLQKHHGYSVDTLLVNVSVLEEPLFMDDIDVCLKARKWGVGANHFIFVTYSPRFSGRRTFRGVSNGQDCQIIHLKPQKFEPSLGHALSHESGHSIFSLPHIVEPMGECNMANVTNVMYPVAFIGYKLPSLSLECAPHRSFKGSKFDRARGRELFVKTLEPLFSRAINETLIRYYINEFNKNPFGAVFFEPWDTLWGTRVVDLNFDLTGGTTCKNTAWIRSTAPPTNSPFVVKYLQRRCECNSINDKCVGARLEFRVQTRADLARQFVNHPFDARLYGYPTADNCTTKNGCTYYCGNTIRPDRLIMRDGTYCVAHHPSIDRPLDGVCVGNGTCVILDNVITTSTLLERQIEHRLYGPGLVNQLKRFGENNIVVWCRIASFRESIPVDTVYKTYHRINETRLGRINIAVAPVQLDPPAAIAYGQAYCTELVKDVESTLSTSNLELRIRVLENSSVKNDVSQDGRHSCGVYHNGRRQLFWIRNSYACDKYSYEYRAALEASNVVFD